MNDPTLQHLLGAVLEDPDDDTARLAYSDRLEELGRDAHAEFVRIQLRLDRGFLEWSPDPDGPVLSKKEWTALHQRERELLTAQNAMEWGPVRTLWKAGLRKPFVTLQPPRQQWLPHPDTYVGLFWARGFVEKITLTSQDWLDFADHFLKACPLREVVIKAWPEVINCREYEEEVLELAVRHGGQTPFLWLLKKCWPDLTFVVPNPDGTGGLPFVLQRNPWR